MSWEIWNQVHFEQGVGLQSLRVKEVFLFYTVRLGRNLQRHFHHH